MTRKRPWRPWRRNGMCREQSRRSDLRSMCFAIFGVTRGFARSAMLAVSTIINRKQGAKGTRLESPLVSPSSVSRARLRPRRADHMRRQGSVSPTVTRAPMSLPNLSLPRLTAVVSPTEPRLLKPILNSNGQDRCWKVRQRRGVGAKLRTGHSL